MRKKRVYVESSVISYLTARPASRPIPRLRQQITAEWWERRREWDCLLTSLVLDEISRGDPEAARLRKEKARLLPVASDLPEADALADLLVACKLVPESSAADAMHLALATLHNAQYLVTWNQKHLDNLDLRFRVEDFIRSQGFTPVQVITPERLLAEGTE